VGELTVSGFPRTGTTYLQQIIQSAFPSLLVIDGHHRIQLLKEAGYKATTLRNPCDAVCSWIVYSHPRPVVVDDALDWYCQFIEQALLSPERIFVFKFDAFTVEPQMQMNWLGNKIGIEPVDIDSASVNAIMSNEFARSFPSKNTELKHEYSKSVMAASLFGKALGLYEQSSSV
jgi:hypothetical protein